MRKTILTASRIIILTLVLVLLGLYISRASHQDDWQGGILCSRFELSLDDRLCNGIKDVYAPDFVRIIKDTFRPYEEYRVQSSEAATYDDVEKKIGTFRYDCEPTVHQADGLIYFLCSYDLRGDREFVMTFIYTYPEKAVMRIMSTSLIYDY